MTNNEELLMLLQDGTPYTLEEIVEATGMTEKAARYALYRLSKEDLVTSKPMLYRVTPAAKPMIAKIRADQPPPKIEARDGSLIASARASRLPIEQVWR